MSSTSTSTSKHPRDGDASDAEAPVKMLKGDDSPTPSSSLATLWDLPFELRSTIFALAYKEDDKDDDTSKGGKRLPRLDRRTLLSLMLVSRDFHSTCSPILYRDVKITQPSMLADFHQSLILRPSNALHVKSLHLGPLTELPQGWWPTRWIRDPLYSDELDFDEYGDTDEPYVVVNTSLASRDDAIRPRWCKPGQEWVHHNPNEPGPTVTRACHERAVTDAISAALKRVGVSLYPDEYADCDSIEDADGRFVDINKWTIRVFEAQAILDLYLAEMRRIEDAEERSIPSWQSKTPPAPHDPPLECGKGECGHYPQLILKGFGNRKHVPREYDFVTLLRLLQGGPPVEASGELGEVDEWVSRILEHASSTKRRVSAASSDLDRYFEARLHPDAVPAVLQAAPSPAVRAGWLDGSLVAGAPNRVRVVQSRAAMTGEHPQGSEDQLQDVKVLWKESEAWWQVCAVECGKLPTVTL